MTVGLFIPCYVDQFYPQVGKATLQLLKKLGCEVEYPTEQACCGQPMANAGFQKHSKKAQKTFTRNFDKYDYVVAPSGSCVLYVREHYPAPRGTAGASDVRSRTYELCEFLADVLNVQELDARFAHKVGLHQSCHGLRGLRLGAGSERQLGDATERSDHHPDKVKRLLQMVSDIELTDVDRDDECCGFGGTFSVTEEAVSVKMGSDRIADHINNRAEIITGTDVSCMMHMEGLSRRRGLPVRFMHVAEILNAGE